MPLGGQVRLQKRQRWQYPGQRSAPIHPNAGIRPPMANKLTGIANQISPPTNPHNPSQK